MKKQVALFALIAALVLSGCVNQRVVEQQLKTRSTTLADKLGRTPKNTVVELPTCGATVCAYSVYFSTEDNFPELDARIHRIGNSPEIALSNIFSPTSTSLLDNMNSDLSKSSIKRRLIVTSGKYVYGPLAAEWVYRNSRGQLAAIVTLFEIRDGSVSYAFDGRPLTGNLVLVQTLFDLNQP